MLELFIKLVRDGIMKLVDVPLEHRADVEKATR